jgi:AraC-like DNA-binding protein
MTIHTRGEWLESDEFPFYTALYPFANKEIIAHHSHEFIEFVYVSYGTGIHKYRGLSFPISAGDVFIVEPSVEHAYEANDDGLQVYNVLFMSSLLTVELETMFKFTPFIDFFYVEPFLRQYSDFQSHLILDQQDRIEITLLLGGLLKEFTNKSMGYHVVIKTQLIHLFIFLSRCYEKHANRSLSSLQDDKEMIQYVCQFIEQHHAQPLTLSQISQLCGMSHTRFSTKFKQFTGMTFIEFRNQVRVSIAKDLLAQTSNKIITISEKVGFDDLSFFNKTFKALVGVSPGGYRKTQKEDPLSLKQVQGSLLLGSGPKF